MTRVPAGAIPDLRATLRASVALSSFFFLALAMPDHTTPFADFLDGLSLRWHKHRHLAYSIR
jgi:hypothetical protein